jgi:FkbH-like protein
VFTANWENKADNIRHIQSILNISFDSMVFIDDNPFERNIVRENIPHICVPELPEDPAEYLEFLYKLNLFETISVSKEDNNRTKLYQIDAKRADFKQLFTNEESFLESLNMTSLVESFNTFNTPRVAQLTQRSNQFNLRTIRYSENDIKIIANSDQYFTFTFTLDDKYGKNGLICIIILQKENNNTLFIDTWLMSCRVLKRGMEHFVLNTIVAFAYEHEYEILRGQYIATKKNELVKDHYLNLGFKENQYGWELKTNTYKEKKCLIKNK